VPIRKIVELALSANATTVILAHNHPSGIAIPSEEDKEATERLAVALNAMDIILADHVVVPDEDFVSLAQSGIFDPKRYCH
jgi:DNA repair protein RadC